MTLEWPRKTGPFLLGGSRAPLGQIIKTREAFFLCCVFVGSRICVPARNYCGPQADAARRWLPSGNPIRKAHEAALSAGLHVDIAALEQIIQAPDAIPAIAVWLQHQPVLAVVARMAVIVRQEIDEQAAALAFQPGRKGDLTRTGIEIVDKHHRIVPPVVAYRQYGGIARHKHLEVAPTDLGHFLAHSDDPRGP